MTDRRENSEGPGERALPDARSDRTAMLALIGVVAVLAVALVGRHQLARLDQALGRVIAGPEVPRLDAARAAAPRPVFRPPDPNHVYTIRTEGAPSRGNPNAPITIVEFGDFQ
jgi:hypothetical protein